MKHSAMTLSAARAAHREKLSELLRLNVARLTPVNVQGWREYDASVDALVTAAQYEAQRVIFWAREYLAHHQSPMGDVNDETHALQHLQHALETLDAT